MDKYTEKKPWGNFELFCKNKSCTVKVLNVNPRAELSLQTHSYRNEFWKILSGKAEIQINSKKIKCKEDDEFFIPKRAKHRIKTNNSSVRILEISFGKFDEKDIIRIEDKYDRK